MLLDRQLFGGQETLLGGEFVERRDGETSWWPLVEVLALASRFAAVLASEQIDLLVVNWPLVGRLLAKKR